MNLERRLSTLLITGAAGALLSQADPSHAQGALTYRYAEVSYISSDYNDVTANGIGVRASFPLGGLLHTFATYSDVQGDFGPFDAGREWLEAGVGFNVPGGRDMDLIGRISYVGVDQDIGGPSLAGTDVDGVGFEAALRKRRNEFWEFRGGLQYIRFDGGQDDFLYRLGTRYNFTQRWAGAFDLSYSDGNPIFGLGARYNFSP